MLATIVTTDNEIDQIIELSRQNARDAVSSEEKSKEGFISWSYTPTLLRQLHQLHPSIIVKDHETLAGYALVAFKESAPFHKDLQAMINHLDQLEYNGKKLADYKYYVMGQVCVSKEYRGKAVFQMLYDKHKELFQQQFDFVLTEISISNKRSMRAHEKAGFRTIFTYKDNMDEWNVVLWDWI